MRILRKDGRNENLESGFCREIVSITGVNVQLCYQCQKCFAGCPLAKYMDISPDKINRMIQYGLKDRILESSTIWLCAACETCVTRCPNEIDIPKVMDALKQLTISEKKKVAQKKISVFHKTFLSNIRKSGVLHEVSLIRNLKMQTGAFFKDIGVGFRLFRKGKLHLFASRIKGMDEIEKIFGKSDGEV